MFKSSTINAKAYDNVLNKKNILLNTNVFALQPQTSSVIFKCRTCQGDHWTLSCPFKHTQLAQAKAGDASKTMGKIELLTCQARAQKDNYQ